MTDTLAQARELVAMGAKSDYVFRGPYVLERAPTIAREYIKAVAFIQGLANLDPRLFSFDGELLRNDVMYKRVVDVVRESARDFLTKIGGGGA